jgi:uncharacterized protein
VRFVDTSFWVAQQFRRDAQHAVARSLWQQHGSSLLTTNHVMGETWTFLRRRLGHAEARAFVERAQRSPRLVIVHVDDATEVDAWLWLRRHDERRYSFVDATSFAVMRRRRISEALAFDGHFSAAGFVEVRL